MLKKLLCWLGFHKPDVENKIEYRPETYSSEDKHWKFYKSKCLRCGISMQGEEPSGY